MNSYAGFYVNGISGKGGLNKTFIYTPTSLHFYYESNEGNPTS
jgi:hypothetical protein